MKCKDCGGEDFQTITECTECGYHVFDDLPTTSKLTESMTNKKDQRIAELEKQLENAIVPKFKVGQELFRISKK